MSRPLHSFLAHAQRAVQVAPAHVENWLMLAHFQQLNGEYAQAIRALEQGWAWAAAEQRKALYLSIGERLLGLYQQQQRGVELALVAQRLLADPELIALGLDSVAIQLQLAEYYLAEGVLADARQQGEAALELAVELGDRRKEGDACFLLGRLCSRCKQHEQAQSFLNRALEIASEQHQAARMANLYSALASLHHLEKQWEQSETMRRNAIRIGELLEHKTGLATDHARLAATLMQQERLKEAQASFEASVALYQVLEDQPSEAAQRLNLGIVLSHREQLDEADEQLQKGWGLYRLLGDEAGQARATELLVKLAQLQKPFATLQ